MRWIVGGTAAHSNAASPSQMGRFETQWLAAPANLSALADLSGQWIELVHGRRPPRGIVLDMDSSVSPTHGEQEMSVWNGHYACACYHPPFVFNQFGDLERCALRPGNVHSADGWDGVLKPVVARYRGKVSRIYFRADATSLKEKLIKIGAKVVSHGRYVVFQMAEVAIPRQMFQEILRLIAELRPQPPPAPA